MSRQSDPSQRIDRAREVLLLLAGRHPINKLLPLSAGDIAALHSLQLGAVAVALRDLEQSGCIERPARGTLRILPNALATFERSGPASVRSAMADRAKKLRQRRSEASGTSIAFGPEPAPSLAPLAPARKADDSEALVEVVRQYAHRRDAFAAKVAELAAFAREQGVEVDPDRVMAGAKFERDKGLDNVSRVLPYIERLERTLERQSRLIEGLQARRKRIVELERENTALRGQNGRLLAAQVGNGCQSGD